MKQQDLHLITESVVERVSLRLDRELQSSLAPLQHNIAGIRSCLERLERILEAQSTKAHDAEEHCIMDAIRATLSSAMELSQPKSLSDQVDEIKTLLDKLNLTVVPKG